MKKITYLLLTSILSISFMKSSFSQTIHINSDNVYDWNCDYSKKENDNHINFSLIAVSREKLDSYLNKDDQHLNINDINFCSKDFVSTNPKLIKQYSTINKTIMERQFVYSSKTFSKDYSTFDFDLILYYQLRKKEDLIYYNLIIEKIISSEKNKEPTIITNYENGKLENNVVKLLHVINPKDKTTVFILVMS